MNKAIMRTWTTIIWMTMTTRICQHRELNDKNGIEGILALGHGKTSLILVLYVQDRTVLKGMERVYSYLFLEE